MDFRVFMLDEAEGTILAHSVRADEQSFKKGRILSTDDIIALKTAGLNSVIAARLEAGDVPEDEAAQAVADAACGDGVRCAAPFTGRCNLYADVHGVALIDQVRLDRINLINEALTIATISPYDLVEPGQMLATIKIIPFAAPQGVISSGTEIAASEMPLVRVAPLREKPVGLVQTRLKNTKESILDKSLEITRNRLTHLGSNLAGEIRCDHTEKAVAAAISDLLKQGCNPILVFGASANVDRRDVVPTGMIRAGGEIDHFGMPVDPGNLLLLGHHRDVPLIGLPGCARSPKENGFDWVLWRLLADIPVTREDVMRMGTGGLLKEIPTRPQPRTGKLSEHQSLGGGVPRMPQIAAIVLAAGQSRRTGKINKLMAEIDGIPMVVRILKEVEASSADPIIIVTGHEAKRISQALESDSLTFVYNKDYANGLSTSLAAGVKALPEHIDGVIVCLGDMPRVKAAHIDKLIAAFNPLESRAICVPTYTGKRGNPVLWGVQFVEEMQNVVGDVGARHLIGSYSELVAEVPIDDDAVLVDVDTLEALTAIKSNS
tara:strand:+ start:230 stop:1870 length:1641 start_codon:yes stop_codon:yes gene_type:complete